MPHGKASPKNGTHKKPIEQYDHKDKKRTNNPPVGLVTPETDQDKPARKYAYDPHLDPRLEWAGKAERTSFEVPTVSLHVHERIEPRTIMEAVRKRNGNGQPIQPSLFGSPAENPPFREAIDFYRHPHNWSNRLIAGDSLKVMNSLLEKEGLAGQVQMAYIDPPYGITYRSNFQPFVNKLEISPADKDEDLTQEPEMVCAFRDTWELGIHSYLTYLRDRLRLAKELLNDSGSCFVQISDENLHFVRNLMSEVFGEDHFIGLLSFQKKGSQSGDFIPSIHEYLVWYAKDKTATKFRRLYVPRNLAGVGGSGFDYLELAGGSERALTQEEKEGRVEVPRGARAFRYNPLFSAKPGPNEPVELNGRPYPSGGASWKISPGHIPRLASMGRVVPQNTRLVFKRYADDFNYVPLTNIWTGLGGATNKVYVVQTNPEVIARCVLMTTDPGDLVLDPTCGSGTTAYVSEQWGRRWITCDTSRVAITLAKQRLMTALYNYYELAHPEEGVGSGFRYKTVPHITLKSIANNEPPTPETLYDQPLIDKSRARVSGPFTVEAVPAPTVKSISEVSTFGPVAEAAQMSLDGTTPPQQVRLACPPAEANASIARSGPTLRHAEWRDELLKTGIRGKGGQMIHFTRVEPLSGTRWIHADAETKPNGKEEKPQRVAVAFGPEDAPLDQRQVEMAWEEARTLRPKPAMIAFAAFQFDPEAAKDIDELTPEKNRDDVSQGADEHRPLDRGPEEEAGEQPKLLVDWPAGRGSAPRQDGRAQGQMAGGSARLRLLQHANRND
ncbi:MAG TPA: site-specific DNA-methyltransferase [Terriglobia bacterium]|nr:site-specific DNA-methyltransferase [Terriglobia bacterium]